MPTFAGFEYLQDASLQSRSLAMEHLPRLESIWIRSARLGRTCHKPRAERHEKLAENLNLKPKCQSRGSLAYFP
ncbi:hypothetical protein U5801_27135, partial [Lamprobacter modestohalophilus]|uniref:hypothetical protein n=1 Tax=Lamprobacter modestohalophilus TaxID=1064514 RepID=UPI002ADEC8E9